MDSWVLASSITYCHQRVCRGQESVLGVLQYGTNPLLLSPKMGSKLRELWTMDDFHSVHGSGQNISQCPNRVVGRA